MTVEADEVIGATTSLKAQGLVRLVHPSHGRSVTRFRQVADELHGWSSAQAAVISTLLLRGPQTLGEIRSRSERLYEFSSGSELDQVVAGLVAGDEPLVRLLERQPGQKESRWQQLLAEEDEPTSRQTPSRSVGDLTERVNELEARVSRLEAALADLLS